jgi:hypothetical protein
MKNRDFLYSTIPNTPTPTHTPLDMLGSILYVVTLPKITLQANVIKIQSRTQVICAVPNLQLFWCSHLFMGKVHVGICFPNRRDERSEREREREHTGANG